MSSTTVTMPAEQFLEVITILRRVIEEHTEEEEGTIRRIRRCTVCSSILRRSRAYPHESDSHCCLVDRKPCWVGELCLVLETLIG
jgi:hypothetical protein